MTGFIYTNLMRYNARKSKQVLRSLSVFYAFDCALRYRFVSGISSNRFLYTGLSRASRSKEHLTVGFDSWPFFPAHDSRKGVVK